MTIKRFPDGSLTANNFPEGLNLTITEISFGFFYVSVSIGILANAFFV